MTGVMVEKAIARPSCLRLVHEGCIMRMNRPQRQAGEGTSLSWREIWNRRLRRCKDMKVGGPDQSAINSISQQASATKSTVDEGMRMFRCATQKGKGSRIGQGNTTSLAILRGNIVTRGKCSGAIVSERGDSESSLPN